MTTFILIAIAVVLFALGYVTKRRFGVLGLGLAAGALLAESWGSQLAVFLAQNNLSVSGISSSALAALILILFPSLVLLVGGPKYSRPMQAVISAIGFALLGLLLCLGAFGVVSSDNDSVQRVFDVMKRYQPSLVAIGVTAAVIDMFLARSSKPGHKKHGQD